MDDQGVEIDTVLLILEIVNANAFTAVMEGRTRRIGDRDLSDEEMEWFRHSSWADLQAASAVLDPELDFYRSESGDR